MTKAFGRKVDAQKVIDEKQTAARITGTDVDPNTEVTL